MKRLILFLRGVLAAVFAVVLAVNGWLYWQESAGSDPPALFGYGLLEVRTADMAPALSKGDLALIRMGKAGKPGEIVLFRDAAGAPVLRRVVGTSGEQLITQAEAAAEPDSTLLDPALVEGIGATWLPGAGGLAGFLRSPPGLITVLVIGAVLLALSFGLDPRRRAASPHTAAAHRRQRLRH